MTLQEKTKYQVMLKAVGGEPMTSKRSWLLKDNALDYLRKSLESGVFAWGTLLILDINDSLIACEEYYGMEV